MIIVTMQLKFTKLKGKSAISKKFRYSYALS